MLCSLRQATKNTMFDQWLEAVNHPASTVPAAPADAVQPAPSSSTRQVSSSGALGGAAMPDPELARFLSPDCNALSPVQARLPTAPTVVSSTFRPGWEDIFRMNQKQLEAAVQRVSADPHLDESR